jgi:hypothetical protein
MLLYEINTRCWLRQLGLRTLAEVPEAELLRWRRQGFTWVWLMGVWSEGTRARAEALKDARRQHFYSKLLPAVGGDCWKEEDVAASPYAIADYQVSAELGGEEGLAAFREALHRHGLKLMLDFVPNHLGLDHPWIEERTELFVQSTEPAPGFFKRRTRAGIRWLAHGKDPNFHPWTDTVQLDYRRSETRAAMIGLLQAVATRCDGVRCDMAMLLLNEVFARTWGEAATPPTVEFWSEAIGAVRSVHANFLFLAEVYWGLEARLQDLGFDFTYDKTLYDHILGRDPVVLQRYLYGLRPEVLAHGAHFLENHDEPRVAALLSTAEHLAAALLVLGLPGMSLLHEGQLEGASIQLPVQLVRRLAEPRRPEIEAIYERLLRVLPETRVGRGRGELVPPQAAWPDNPTGLDCVLIQWRDQEPGLDLVAVNMAAHPSQSRVSLNLEPPLSRGWRIENLLGPERSFCEEAELCHPGLLIELPAYGARLLRLSPASA